MKIIALEHSSPGALSSAFPPLLQAEAARVWQLYQAGYIREIYFRQDRSDSVLILECANLEEAHALLASLPLVQANLIDFELIPLRAYPGFARLFAPDSLPPG